MREERTAEKKLNLKSRTKRKKSSTNNTKCQLKIRSSYMENT